MRRFIDIITESSLRGVPQDVVERYSCGDCMWLAVALNQRFGWPIRAQMERDTQHGDYVAHAYCVMPDGREIDILGPQEQVDIWTTDVQEWDADELLATMSNQPSEAKRKLADANAVIDRYIVPRLDLNENAQPWLDHTEDEVEYDQWKPEYGIDNFVRSTFSTGACGYLALVLHDKTGWPIRAEIDVPRERYETLGGDIEHIWVENPKWQAVDINGVHPEAFARTKFTDVPGDVVSLSYDYLLHSCNDAELLDWARVLVEKFPKHFGLPDA